MKQSKPSKIRAVLGAIKKLISFSRRRDIKEMQEKYEANKEKKIKVILTDLKRAVIFKVQDGKMNWMAKGAEDIEGDVEAYTESDHFLNLLAGRIKVRNHATGKLEYRPYRYYDAVRWGDVKAYGDMASNDNQLAIRVFDDLLTDFQHELFPEVHAMLEEEDD